MLKDINQIKALILIVSSNIGKTTSDKLISSVIATDLADIADITDAFVFLSEDGMLTLADSGKICSISEKGSAILPELSTLLNQGIVSEAVLKATRFHNGAEYFAEIEEKDGVFTLVCTYLENKKTVCQVNLGFDDEKSALLAKVNFLKRPDAVMNGVMAAVTGKIDYLM